MNPAFSIREADGKLSGGMVLGVAEFLTDQGLPRGLSREILRYEPWEKAPVFCVPPSDIAIVNGVS